MIEWEISLNNSVNKALILGEYILDNGLIHTDKISINEAELKKELIGNLKILMKPLTRFFQ